MYPPLQGPKDPIAPALKTLLRRPLPAQAMTITGAAKYPDRRHGQAGRGVRYRQNPYVDRDRPCSREWQTVFDARDVPAAPSKRVSRGKLNQPRRSLRRSDRTEISRALYIYERRTTEDGMIECVEEVSNKSQAMSFG
jgi:hypothetical protein